MLCGPTLDFGVTFKSFLEYVLFGSLFIWRENDYGLEKVDIRANLPSSQKFCCTSLFA